MAKKKASWKKRVFSPLVVDKSDSFTKRFIKKPKKKKGDVVLERMSKYL